MRLHLGPEAKPHLVNRLDRKTSGVTLVAKNAAVAGELGRLWETRGGENISPSFTVMCVRNRGLIDAPLGRTSRHRWRQDCVRVDGTPAQTGLGGRFVRERPLTPASPIGRGEGERRDAVVYIAAVAATRGEAYQIRIHLAHLRHPIVGDRFMVATRICISHWWRTA